MSEMSDWNAKIVEEFRINDGRVGGPFEGAPMILVHHKGRKSGTPRVNPLVYQKVDGGWAIFASFAGATHNPDWYGNLMADPHTTIEVGSETFDVVAREASGAERTEIWERQKAASPGFADYEVKAGDRVIPVVVLEPAG
jgi:deazaflavin-dependent oxidoreductase (nitroreductase family)